MQLIVMTSDKYYHLLNPFFYLVNKYMDMSKLEPVICGFTFSERVKQVCKLWGVKFYSIGEYKDFPPNRWSNAFKRVLDNVAGETFIFMLEDYWLVRQVDMHGVELLFDFAKQNKNILKVDLAADRLYSDVGRYAYGFNTDRHIGHLDLIKSPRGTQYQMSFWGGIFNRDNLYKVLVPGETAQEIELNGTTRVNKFESGMDVYGTRQIPMLHGNIYQGGKFNRYETDTWKVNLDDIKHMKSLGMVK